MESPPTTVDLGIAGLTDATQIGRGGSGLVFSARQEAFDRPVAVKVIPGGGDHDVHRRVERERRAIGRLAGVPGVLPIYETGVNASGDLYFVMELQQGGSLADRLELGGPLPWHEATRIMIDVASTLDAAHSRGLVHCDIKPANILMTPSADPLVADFGTARPLLYTASDPTVTGVALTPAYSPPEAFDGVAADISFDVYGLGATLWALIAGRPPFVDTDNLGLGALILRIGHASPGDLRGLAPDPVCDVIERAMAKTPGHRFGSARSFARALDAAVRDASTTTLVPAFATPMAEPGRSSGAETRRALARQGAHRPLPSVAVASLALALLLAVGISVASTRSGEPAERDAAASDAPDGAGDAPDVASAAIPPAAIEPGDRSGSLGSRALEDAGCVEVIDLGGDTSCVGKPLGNHGVVYRLVDVAADDPDGGLLVWAGPGLGGRAPEGRHRQVGVIPPGATTVVASGIGTEDGWWLVSYTGAGAEQTVEGWVYARFLGPT